MPNKSPKTWKLYGHVSSINIFVFPSLTYHISLHYLDIKLISLINGITHHIVMTLVVFTFHFINTVYPVVCFHKIRNIYCKLVETANDFMSS